LKLSVAEYFFYSAYRPNWKNLTILWLTFATYVLIFAKKKIMMMLNLQMVFEKYPFKQSQIAVSLHRSREWIVKLTKTKQYTNTDYNNLVLVNEYLNKIGAELSGIRLSGLDEEGSMDVAEFFDRYPFTVAGIAKYTGHTREFLSSIVFNRYKNSDKARERHIKKIEEVVRKFGRELSTLKIVVILTGKELCAQINH
jgi:CRP-like cAMP-binding protein